MSNKADFSNPTVFQKNLKTIDDLLSVLLDFLKDGTPVTIKNKDFVPCYEYFYETETYFIVLFSMPHHRMTKSQKNSLITFKRELAAMPSTY